MESVVLKDDMSLAEVREGLFRMMQIVDTLDLQEFGDATGSEVKPVFGMEDFSASTSHEFMQARNNELYEELKQAQAEAEYVLKTNEALSREVENLRMENLNLRENLNLANRVVEMERCERDNARPGTDLRGQIATLKAEMATLDEKYRNSLERGMAMACKLSELKETKTQQEVN